MKMTPLQKRQDRKNRSRQLVDMNLVSLIDIFTLLIFFLLANSSEVDILPSSKSIQLPQSIADKAPKETVVVMVSGEDILVQGYKVAAVADVLRMDGDLIQPLEEELNRQAARIIRQDNKNVVNKAVTIVGDKAIPYKLLRKVMVTCARANYADVSFAVSKKGKA
jgi:biopolymer transport protein ExbD